MLLRFPDADSLVSALKMKLVPADVARASVLAATDASGAIWITPPRGIDRRRLVRSRLAEVAKPPENSQLIEARSWVELVPAIPSSEGSPEVVLFRLSDSTALIQLVGELHRLGCRTMEFCRHGRGEAESILVRVVRPPTHTLNRFGPLTAFVQRAPQVWVEFGYSHPLADIIQPRSGRQLFIPGKGQWQLISDPDFTPVDGRQSLVVSGRHPLKTVAARIRISLTARLKHAESSLSASFWVLPSGGVDRLHQFVESADERTVADLDFAVSNQGEVALFSRTLLRGPPVLAFEAIGFVPLQRLSNVFIPIDARLHPPVRRDMLRDWFAKGNQITWLHPAGGGRFRVTSVAADAFRPLAEWIEYTTQAATRRVVQRPTSTIFAPVPFTAPEEVRRQPSQPRIRHDATQSLPSPTPTTLPKVVKGTAPPKPVEIGPERLEEIEPMPPAEAVVRLGELERAFLAIEGPLDSVERQSLWPELAETSAAAGDEEDAGICWGHALWEAQPVAGAQRWLRSERRHLGNLSSALESAEPRLGDLRAIAAIVFEAASRPSCPPDLDARLPRIHRVLEEHDFRLPIRVAWLAWLSVSKLSGGDVLAVTRARDRLLRDLHENGLRRDRDVPTFMRTGSVRQAERGPAGSARFLRLRELARQWCPRHEPMQRIYIDLVFAYALARYGDAGTARALLDEIGRPDDPPNRGQKHRPNPQAVEPYQRWIWEAYRERVLRQIGHEPANAPLSPDRRRALAALTKEYGREPGPIQRQSAEKVIQASRILEPFDRVDPYRAMRQHDTLGEALSEIAATPAPARKRDHGGEQIELQFRTLLKQHPGGWPAFRVLQIAVPMSVRVGESFGIECVGKVRPTLDKLGRWGDVSDLINRVRLLYDAVEIAAHFGRPALIDPLLDALHRLLASTKGEVAAWVAASLNGNSFRFLSRLGLIDASRSLLARLNNAITDGHTLGKYLRTPAINRGVVYPALLRLAAGWFYFGNHDPARLALSTVRKELFEGSMSPEPRNRLAADYAMALGHEEIERAMTGYTEFFERLTVTGYEPQGTIQRLRIVEAVALAMASEDFTADTQSRHWLDEDEFLVRRRIHRDVHAMLSGAES